MMKRHRSWFLAAGAIVGLTSAGVPRAGAHSAQRPSYSVPKGATGLSRTQSRPHDGRFFLGHGGAVRGPFHLNGGKYVINVLGELQLRL